MKRPPFHFFIVTANRNGKSLISLPGQTFGQIPVPANILVKDSRGSTAVSRARRKAKEGQVYYTASLKKTGTGLSASDMTLLAPGDDIFQAQAQACYEALMEYNNAKH